MQTQYIEGFVFFVVSNTYLGSWNASPADEELLPSMGRRTGIL